MWFGSKKAGALATAVALMLLRLPEPIEAAVCDKSAEQIFAAATDSVARISVVSIDPFNPVRKVRYGIGTGFLLNDESIMVTNYHVVLDAKFIDVSLGGGRNLSASILAGDPVFDIALLKLDTGQDQLKALPLAEEATPAIGTEVFAIGHPLGLPISISKGIVSSVDVILPITTSSWDEPYIQTDAAINPGNSGGPLIDRCGRVIGMNTLGTPMAENMGYAIPIGIVKRVAAELMETGKISRPWIGISGSMADPFILSLAMLPSETGFMIETIEPGSAADTAGLRGGSLPLRVGMRTYVVGGDIITKVNGEALTDLSTVARIVRSLKPGDKVSVEYFRDGELQTIEVVLPERPMLPEDIRVLREVGLRQQGEQ
jgi:putative serine protease PepD